MNRWTDHTAKHMDLTAGCHLAAGMGLFQVFVCMALNSIRLSASSSRISEEANGGICALLMSMSRHRAAYMYSAFKQTNPDHN